MVKYFCDLTVILRLYPVFTFHKLVDKSSQFPFSFFSSTKTSGLLSDWRSRNIFLWNKETPEKIKRSGNWHPKEVWYIYLLCIDYPVSTLPPYRWESRSWWRKNKRRQKQPTRGVSVSSWSEPSSLSVVISDVMMRPRLSRQYYGQPVPPDSLTDYNGGCGLVHITNVFLHYLHIWLIKEKRSHWSALFMVEHLTVSVLNSLKYVGLECRL